jgi:methylated-DNA-[protein]-cysteine S-methyltransferase
VADQQARTVKTSSYYYSEFQTPAGRFALAVDDAGAVAATAFGGKVALRGRLKGAALVADPRRTAAARSQVLAWFKGKRRTFTVALSPGGTPFQRKVWAALRRIPFGETRSYGDVARTVGSAPRAVGRANATNPICLIVPCHRVVGADGSLTGFAFGEATKRLLLDFEVA